MPNEESTNQAAGRITNQQRAKLINGLAEGGFAKTSKLNRSTFELDNSVKKPMSVPDDMRGKLGAFFGNLREYASQLTKYKNLLLEDYWITTSLEVCGQKLVQYVVETSSKALKTTKEQY